MQCRQHLQLPAMMVLHVVLLADQDNLARRRIGQNAGGRHTLEPLAIKGQPAPCLAASLGGLGALSTGNHRPRQTPHRHPSKAAPDRYDENILRSSENPRLFACLAPKARPAILASSVLRPDCPLRQGIEPAKKDAHTGFRTDRGAKVTLRQQAFSASKA